MYIFTQWWERTSSLPIWFNYMIWPSMSLMKNGFHLLQRWRSDCKTRKWYSTALGKHKYTTTVIPRLLGCLIAVWLGQQWSLIVAVECSNFTCHTVCYNVCGIPKCCLWWMARWERTCQPFPLKMTYLADSESSGTWIVTYTKHDINYWNILKYQQEFICLGSHLLFTYYI